MVVISGRSWWFSARDDLVEPDSARRSIPGANEIHIVVRCMQEHLPVGRTYSAIDDSLRQFIESQPVFFVGSAPLDAGGHVNVSPKGLDTLRVLGPAEIAYLDLTGSGIETLSHIRENGRIVLMFCAFDGPPKIVRIYGQGRALEPGDARFASLLAAFPEHEGVRAIITVEITRIADSCGFGVPRMRLEAQRDQLPAWTSRKGLAGMKLYRSGKNQRSIDGLPGLKA